MEESRRHRSGVSPRPFWLIFLWSKCFTLSWCLISPFLWYIFKIIWLLLIFNTIFFFQIKDLKADTGYMFVVRSENAEGLSGASPVSALFRTLSANSRDVAPQQLDEARIRLAAKILHLEKLQSPSSTTVRINWQVLKTFNNFYSSLPLIFFFLLFIS